MLREPWVGVTTEWLGFGFSRGYDAPPTHPYNASTATAPYCQNFSTASYPAGQCQNGISPAILILQQLQSSVGPGGATGAATTQYNWLPINFYDSREGEPRDSRPAGDTGANCSPNGIMNAVELDVGNLWLWLQGAAGTPYAGKSGPLVSPNAVFNANGYILYFADHRGMIADKYPLTTFYNNFSGMSGLNDTVNSSSQLGVPDGVLEPITYYASTPHRPRWVFAGRHGGKGCGGESRERRQLGREIFGRRFRPLRRSYERALLHSRHHHQ